MSHGMNALGVPKKTAAISGSILGIDRSTSLSSVPAYIPMGTYTQSFTVFPTIDSNHDNFSLDSLGMLFTIHLTSSSGEEKEEGLLPLSTEAAGVCGLKEGWFG
jgi:hypothetical protein